MSKIKKRALSLFVAMATLVSMSFVVYASWQPDWAYYTDYDDAFMFRSCDFTNGGKTFEGVMGLHATSPYGTVKMETGSSEISSGVTYSTKADCVYLDSSGNEQTYTKSGTSRISFQARGASQMFSEIIGTHKSTYNGTTRGGATIY